MFNDIIIQSLIKSIIIYKNTYGINATRYEFEDKIIAMNNPSLSYFFRLEMESTRYEHDLIVSNSKDPELIYNYALNVKNADIKLLQNALLGLKDIISSQTYFKYLNLFLKNILNCDSMSIKKEINTLNKERKL